MPGLTVDTSPSSQRTQTPSVQTPHTSSRQNSRSASPVRPPVSPITPTLGPARLATSPHDAPPQRRTYTHSQPPQTSIPQPPPITVAFDENPDALALKSAISILQLQAKNATADIKTLHAIKERALKEPEDFGRALAAGDLKAKKDGLFDFSKDDSEEDDEDDGEPMQVDGKKDEKQWPKLPTPQNVVRAPPINWNQYVVIGESLDKIHADQQARPTEGMPQRLGADGSLSYGGDGLRRSADIGVAAPYQLGRDKIEKMSTRKGGKR